MSDSFKYVLVNGTKYPWNPAAIDLDDPDQTREFQLTQSEIDALFASWDTTDTKKIVCECGGAKLNTTHSFWCPVYKEYK